MASHSIELVRADDPAWDTWLEAVPRDIYHLAGYHRWARGSGEGEPYLAVVGDGRSGIVWPYLLRPVAQVTELSGSEAMDVTSVYGYPGPLAWGCGPGDPFLAEAWSEILQIWRDQRAVSVFTRFHPLLDNAPLLSGLPSLTEPGDGVIPNGPTVSVDCALDDEAARAGYAARVRQQINQHRRAGLATLRDEQWIDLPAFARVYRETMIRNRARSFYLFDEADFRRLREALPGSVHLFVTRMGSEVASAAIITETAGIAELHLVGTSDAYRSLAPQKILIDDVRAWAHMRGDAVFHLGGGVGGREDSLFTFKSRFSRRRHLFHTGRWILAPGTYRDLVRVRCAGGGSAGPLDPDFFPAYRAPVLAPDRSSAQAPGA